MPVLFKHSSVLSVIHVCYLHQSKPQNATQYIVLYTLNESITYCATTVSHFLYVNFYIVSVLCLHCFEWFKSNVRAKYVILSYKTRWTTHISWPHSANTAHRINKCQYHTIIFQVQVKLLKINSSTATFYCKWKVYVYHITLLILVLF